MFGMENEHQVWVPSMFLANFLHTNERITECDGVSAMLLVVAKSQTKEHRTCFSHDNGRHRR